MPIDLTGGIDPSREYVFAERPDNPEMRDSVSFWTVDDHGESGLPAHRDRGRRRELGQPRHAGQRRLPGRAGVPAA